MGQYSTVSGYRGSRTGPVSSAVVASVSGAGSDGAASAVFVVDTADGACLASALLPSIMDNDPYTS